MGDRPLLLSPVILFVTVSFEVVILLQTPRESFCVAEKAQVLPYLAVEALDAPPDPLVGFGHHSASRLGAFGASNPFPTHRPIRLWVGIGVGGAKSTEPRSG